MRQSRMRQIAPVMQWGWNSYGDALLLSFAALLTDTKQSLVLSHKEREHLINEALRRRDTTAPSPIPHSKMTRDEFEASTIVGGKVVSIVGSVPTMLPTFKV